MRYVDYRDSIRKELSKSSAGLTWAQLQSKLSLPYERPCPEWTNRLEEEIGLIRAKGSERALVWKLGKHAP
jgi:hypothetical protein